jgi:hypothetical protein
MYTYMPTKENKLTRFGEYIRHHEVVMHVIQKLTNPAHLRQHPGSLTCPFHTD